MSCNGQRQGFIITCASYQKEIAMAVQSNSPFGEIEIRLGTDFSGATKRGGRGRVLPRVEREGHSRQVSRHLSH